MDGAHPPNARDGAARTSVRQPAARQGLRLELAAPTASVEEAAAIVAALERFMRATAPRPEPGLQAGDAWRRAGVLEGVEHWESGDLSDPWINT